MADTRDHYIELAVPVCWVGLCSSCRAVHIRGAQTLVTMDGIQVHYDPLSPERRREWRPSMTRVRMGKLCGRVNGKWAKHARGDNPECTGLVFEEPNHEALMAAYLLHGPFAVIDLVDARVAALDEERAHRARPYRASE